MIGLFSNMKIPLSITLFTRKTKRNPKYIICYFYYFFIRKAPNRLNLIELIHIFVSEKK